MKRWARGLAAIAVGVGSAICTSAPASSAPAADAATCAFAPTSIAIVVDFGDAAPVSSLCVPADSTDSGLSVLAARADELGTAAPRFNSAGLLCAIDGIPADGCGEQTGSKYAYWSYWHGVNGVWSYSSIGPSARAHATTVEGWRFQPQGSGNPSDPPPRGSADPAATCAPPPPPTSTSAVPPAGSTSGETTPQSTATAGPTDNVAVESESTTVPSSSSSSSSTGSAAAQAAAGPVRVTARDKGGGPVLGMLAGGGLVMALGVAGAIIARRRRASP